MCPGRLILLRIGYSSTRVRWRHLQDQAPRNGPDNPAGTDGRQHLQQTEREPVGRGVAGTRTFRGCGPDRFRTQGGSRSARSTAARPGVAGATLRRSGLDRHADPANTLIWQEPAVSLPRPSDVLSGSECCAARVPPYLNSAGSNCHRPVLSMQPIHSSVPAVGQHQRARSKHALRLGADQCPSRLGVWS